MEKAPVIVLDYLPIVPVRSRVLRIRQYRVFGRCGVRLTTVCNAKTERGNDESKSGDNLDKRREKDYLSQRPPKPCTTIKTVYKADGNHGANCATDSLFSPDTALLTNSRLSHLCFLILTNKPCKQQFLKDFILFH